VAGCFENGNEPWGSIKDEQFLEEMNDSQLLKNGVAASIQCAVRQIRQRKLQAMNVCICL
jgi:hypothetical protein